MNTSVSAFTKTKRRLTDIVPEIVFVLLLIQPVLDVISHWATEWEITTYTTIFRFLMLAAVLLYSFIISDRKGIYILFGGVIALYWILHVVACLRAEGGYLSPFSDLTNLLRTVQLPLFTLSFITFFKKSDLVPQKIQCAFFANMVIMIHSIILSYMTGTQIYTYVDSQKGLMGWATVHNAQSAILTFVIPLLLLFVYKKKNKWLFYATCIVCFGILFFTGTKVDYYAIFIIAPAVMIFLFIQGERSPFYYVTLLCITLACLFCYNTSVAHDIWTDHTVAMGYRQDYVDNLLIGTDIEESDKQQNVLGLHLPKDLNKESYEALDDRMKELIQEVYDLYLHPMVNRFGFERVIEKYEYSLDVSNLTEQRQQKRFFAELAWEDSNFLTRCFGYEYITLIEHYTLEIEEGEFQEYEMNYDLENDFPSVFYYSGYVGFAIYMLFLLYFAALAAVGVLTRGMKLITMETGMVGITFGLAMGVSQFSGNVLRRPNASIYVSVILAYIYYLTVIQYNVKLRDIFGVFNKEKRKLWKNSTPQKVSTAEEK